MAYGYAYIKALKSYMMYPRYPTPAVPTKKVEVKPAPAYTAKYVRTVRVKCPKCGQELTITITVE